MTQAPAGYSQDEVLALSEAPPLREIEIGGHIYPLGDLDEAKMADMSAWGARIVASQQNGTPLAIEDTDPSRPLQHLLYSGDPNFRWVHVRASVKQEHCAAGAKEVFRQSVVKALAAASMAGRA